MYFTIIHDLDPDRIPDHPQKLNNCSLARNTPLITVSCKPTNRQPDILTDRSTNKTKNITFLAEVITRKSYFTQASPDENFKIIQLQNPAHQSQYTTWLSTEHLEVMLPVITDTVNLSLSTGVF